MQNKNDFHFQTTPDSGWVTTTSDDEGKFLAILKLSHFNYYDMFLLYYMRSFLVCLKR